MLNSHLLPKPFFITATGTNVGKTYITCLLIKALKARGKEVHAIKPVISGWTEDAPETTDTGLLLQSLGHPILPATITRLSPWRFTAPLSPHMAAKREGKEIDFKELLLFCFMALRGTEYLLVEGAGGVMVPITDTLHTADWIKALEWPVILVTGSYLGAISHTLTALTTLMHYHLPLTALIVNESEDSGVPLDETVETLKNFTDAPIITVPRHAKAIDLTALLKL